MRWAALEILRWGCAGAGLRWRWAALLRWAALACCAGPALALACAGAELRCALACAALGFLDLRWRWAALRWPALAALACAALAALGLRWRWAALALGCAGAGLR